MDAVLFGSPNFGNSALVKGIAGALVNLRTLAFDLDAVPQLPCRSALADRAASMPACLYPVPAPTRLSPFGPTYWSE